MASAYAATAPAQHWTAGLTRTHWKVLTASFLGWIFDGYETYALISVLAPALLAVLPLGERSRLPVYAGLAIGLTLLGWGVGGVAGGILTDYIGRKRMMLISILGYSLFTGLTALSGSIAALIAFRFLTGLFMGSEWGTGATLLAETWPTGARPKGAGFMQSGFGFGAFLAAIIWYFFRPLGPEAWRWMFVVGVAPAFLVLYIRRSIDESERWVQTVRQKRWAVTEAAATGPRAARRPFTLAHVFSDPQGRSRILMGLALSVDTTVGWWSVATWIPTHVGALARQAGQNAAYWASVAGVLYNVGGILGYLSGGFLADALGRRLYLLLLYVGSLVLTPAVYLWTHALGAVLAAATVNGFFTSGGFTWMAIYLP
jgi:MFS family permease